VDRGFTGDRQTETFAQKTIFAASWNARGKPAVASGPCRSKLEKLVSGPPYMGVFVMLKPSPRSSIEYRSLNRMVFSSARLICGSAGFRIVENRSGLTRSVYAARVE
jgi:hypothetical protein